jgi:hypothetical protein
MPIILIWNELAAPRERQFKRWLTELSVAAGLLKSWLSKRLSEGERIERETRGFPIFQFFNQALTARIAPFQHGVLVTEPRSGLRGNMEAVANAWRLGDEWSLRAREARLINELMGVLVDITQAARDSVERYSTPSASMFNPNTAQVSDLFGLGALTFRSLGEGRAGLWEAAQRIERAMRPELPANPVAAGAISMSAGIAGRIGGPIAEARVYAWTHGLFSGSGAVEGPATLPLAMGLDEILRYIAGAILIIPALSALVMEMGQDLLLWVRQTVIEELFSIEQWVFEFRQNLLTGLSSGLNAFSQTAAQFLVMARDYALAHLSHWARFSVAYVEGLMNGIGAFTDQLGAFWNGVNDLIQALMSYTQRLMDIQLGAVVHNVLVLIADAIDWLDTNFYPATESPPDYDAPNQFPVTIGELVLNEGGGVRARNELTTATARFGEALRGAQGLGPYQAVGSHFMGMNLFGLVPAVAQLLPRLARAPLAARPQPVLRYTAATEPDLVAAIITPLRQGFTHSLTEITDGAGRTIEGITGGLTNMLDGVAADFSAAATDAVRLGSFRNVRRIIASAEGLVQRVFPDMAPSSTTGLERTAQVFAVWLQGHFNAVGAVIGGYLGFLLDQWRQHLEANEDTSVAVTPTSPRILLERARLGRVHLEEMRIVARPQATDGDLARRVAEGFRAAVRDAYVRGEARLGEFRATAQAAGGQ